MVAAFAEAQPGLRTRIVLRDVHLEGSSMSMQMQPLLVINCSAIVLVE